MEIQVAGIPLLRTATVLAALCPGNTGRSHKVLTASRYFTYTLHQHTAGAMCNVHCASLTCDVIGEGKC